LGTCEDIFWFAWGRELFKNGLMGFFLNEEVGVLEFAGWLELEIVVIKFEKTLTLREMVYLEGNLSSLRAGHNA
jgi:hypothetical protein